MTENRSDISKCVECEYGTDTTNKENNMNNTNNTKNRDCDELIRDLRAKPADTALAANSREEYVKAVLSHYYERAGTNILVRAIAEQYWYETVYGSNHKDTFASLSGVLSYQFLNQVWRDCVTEAHIIKEA